MKAALSLFVLVGLSLAPAALAQDAAASSPEQPPTPHEISPGIWELGAIRIDKTKRNVSFPTSVNMVEGVLEYLLVTPSGSAHESLLVTNDPQPRNLHIAMLLLGAKGAALDAAHPQSEPVPQLNKESLSHTADLKGDPISITVSWTDKNGAEKTVPVEDWLTNASTKKPADHGPWTYSGSMFSSSGKFLAQEEGNFAALVKNPATLINNPRKGNDDDQLWIVNEKNVPPKDTPVKVTLTLMESSHK